MSTLYTRRGTVGEAVSPRCHSGVLGLILALSTALTTQVAAQGFSVMVSSDQFGTGFVLNPGPAVTPLAPNTTETFNYLVTVAPDHFLAFDIDATNTNGTAFDLTLTNFEFRTPVPCPGCGPFPNGEFLRVMIWADFTATAGSYTATHDVSGDLTFQGGQTGFVEKCGQHAGTYLTCIGTMITPTSGPFTLGPASALVSTTGVYSVWSEYTFGITVGTSGYGSIVLPNSGHDGAVVLGACCFESAACVLLPQAACEQQGGVYIGDGTDCDPDPCQGVPAETTNWGRIKANYRE